MMMKNRNVFLWCGIGLGGICLILLGMSFFPLGFKSMTPAITFLALGALFNFLQYFAQLAWEWKGWLFIPNLTFTAFGVVFTLNTLTGDWNAWAYAWLICIAGLALGLALAIRATGKLSFFYQPSLWIALGSLSFACIFGAIAGGLFLKIFILLVIVLFGLFLCFNWQKNNHTLDWATLFSAGNKAAMPVSPVRAGESLVEPLSKREVEVLELIALGLTNAEIAARLVVATSTVKTHINNIYSKLGVTTRTAALKKAHDLGLLQN